MKIKTLLMLLALSLAITAEGAAKDCAASISVEISNKSKIDRINESVTTEWTTITKKLKGVSPDNVIVLDPQGKVIPSQVLYNGEKTAQSLLFQVTVAPSKSAKYKITTGKREEYKQAAYGRFAPERMDDFIWENNRVAFRVYGKALEVELISTGIDIWLKRTPEMIINKWLKPNVNYHRDNGEGLDMYSVGKSLGLGALTPIVDGKLLYLPHNHTSYKVLDCGALRVSFELEYPSFKVNGESVTMVRRFTLDAFANLNHVEVTFTGSFKNIDVVNGIKVRKNVDDVVMGANYIAYQEPEHPKNGTTYLLMINSRSSESKMLEGHAVSPLTLKSGETYSYLTGGYWSKYGVPNNAAWADKIAEEVTKAAEPLRVRLR